MKNFTHKSKYFYGHEVSEYGLKNGYIDYRTLSMAFDMVLCNDITSLFYSTINKEFCEPEQVNGFIDNSDEIHELTERADAIEEEQSELDEQSDKFNELQSELEEIREKIEELESEQEASDEIYQYFIISERGAEILQDLTNEIVYFLPNLNIYIWGVTHWGTSWDYVLTDIKIELDESEQPEQ